jgi:signal recognition particle receptor subunit beta
VTCCPVLASCSFLYDILTDARMDEGPPVLVACSKSDVASAKAPSRVKTLFTAEL